MVRLEVKKSYLTFFRKEVSIPVWFDWKQRLQTNNTSVNWFQFQYGSIGSHYLPIICSDWSRFQFQYGSIGS